MGGRAPRGRSRRRVPARTRPPPAGAGEGARRHSKQSLVELVMIPSCNLQHGQHQSTLAPMWSKKSCLWRHRRHSTLEGVNLGDDTHERCTRSDDPARSLEIRTGKKQGKESPCASISP